VIARTRDAPGSAAQLKALAASGRTIICTIHQPSSEIFHLFDRVRGARTPPWRSSHRCPRRL
jgi:hypothetical protein